MRVTRLLVVGLVVLLFCQGCIYTNVTSPGSVQTLTQFQLDSEDFTVIERVSVTGESTLWFGAVLTGGKGYQALLEEAQQVGGDEVMNYSFDVENKAVFWFIYHKVTWKATGLAVKLKDHVLR